MMLQNADNICPFIKIKNVASIHLSFGDLTIVISSGILFIIILVFDSRISSLLFSFTLITDFSLTFVLFSLFRLSFDLNYEYKLPDSPTDYFKDTIS